MSEENRSDAAAGTEGSTEARGSTAAGPQQELTPEQYGRQHETEQAEQASDIRGVYSASDAYGRMQGLLDGLPFGGAPSPGGLFGRTDFDNPAYRLNDMLALIQHAKPNDLENAGDALLKAKDKLNEAAEELDQYVTRVDWKGQGAEEFRRFGRALAQHAWSVGTFANSAGTQMKTASTGLASVRGAMPPRDGRLDQRTPEDFPIIAQVPDNQEYQAAVKVERDRQEAITQMNRLASFYAVSEEMLAGQEEPRFPEGLKAAVPRPSSDRTPSGSVPARGTTSALSASSDPGASEVSGSATSPGGTAAPAPPRNISMGIDSVAAPPAPPTTTGPTLPTTAPSPGPTNGPVPPFTSGPVHQIQTGKRGSPTPSKATPPRSTGPVGRPGNASTTTPVTGRSPGITGRPTAVGTEQTSPGRSSSVGRPGIVGGTPSPRPVAASGQNGPVGRAGSGIMGGSPQRAGTGSPSSRMPRGTVVGAEGPAAGRNTPARPGQSGVIGSNADGAPRPAGRVTPGTNGIVGAPRGSTPGRRTASGPFTAGGTGLAGGRAGQRRCNEDEQDGSDRPDYLTEDEETWAARRRGAVPPVID
ncbi:hypothetical protein [Streptomyces sp. KLOTTS4A1]|uniref:hypothetical protein n=1 Tax=Streptomyces sp. KLOTTS4A1 TaxID=3390996 RepID=UPI0039F48B1B